MPKKTLTAEGITKEIGRRIKASAALDGDCRDCRAPTPRRVDPKDYPGANWLCDTLDATDPGCVPVIVAICNDVRREYDCSDW